MSYKKQALHLEGLLSFYVEHQNATTLPSGMFLIALCMFCCLHAAQKYARMFLTPKKSCFFPNYFIVPVSNLS
jgi:hypothetical protein